MILFLNDKRLHCSNNSNNCSSEPFNLKINRCPCTMILPYNQIVRKLIEVRRIFDTNDIEYKIIIVVNSHS